MFSFRKLYADLVAEDGTVCIVYLTWLRVMGYSRFLGGVEIYGRDGNRAIFRARGAELDPPSLTPFRPMRVSLDVPNGPFYLHFSDRTAPYVPAGSSPDDALTWSVAVSRSAGYACWPRNGSMPDLHGTGYADWLELRKVTRQFGICSLDWGRLHLPQVTVIYNAVRFRSRPDWKRLAYLPTGGAAVESTDFLTRWQDGSMELAVPNGASPCPPTFVLRPLRVLHHGPAIDACRFPGLVERTAFNAITGRSRETRWLSHVHGEGLSCNPGFAVHERVLFGREASPS